MKITRISVYGIDLPFKPLGSRWLGRSKPTHLHSTIVRIETDAGLDGFGESCPIGAIYLPVFPEGVHAAIGVMAPALIGQDPTEIEAINRVMDASLFGYPAAKAAIDIACWDLLGKSTGLPVHALLGGAHQHEVPLYSSIFLESPQTMVETLRERQEQGYQRFQVKVGGDPMEDVERIRGVVGAGRPGDLFMVDANRGWTKADALRVVKCIDDVDCYIEQPCATYEEILAVRQRCRHPFILDEIIDDATDLARAIADDALDGLVIKVTHAGGISSARILRDMCISHGIQFRIEDTAGSEITVSAQAHLAAATPLGPQLGSYPFLNDMDPVADGAPEVAEGCLIVSDEPGLGIVPRSEVLGEPLAEYT